MRKYLTATVTVALCFLFSLSVCLSALTQTAGNTQTATVVLDAGHGGVDVGVTGSTLKLKESEVNLKIAQKLQEELTQLGFNVVLTRKTDAGLYGVLSHGFKKRDMLKRKEIIENASPTMVVSIHQNAFQGDARRGGQAFFKKGNAEGERLAKEIQKSINSMPESVKKTDALAGDYYILNCTEYTSVICECGFLSNEEDERLLASEEYQKALSKAIAQGIVRYLSKETGQGGD